MLFITACVVSTRALTSPPNGWLARTNVPQISERMRLEAVQQAVMDGQYISGAEDAAMAAIGGKLSSTYGEITPLGFSALGQRLKLGPGDTFVDCGSGLGRCVAQAVHEFGVSQSFGIEFSSSRHNLAVAALQCDDADDALSDRICLVQGDCADATWWAGSSEASKCTCAYTCNILFDDALNRRLKHCFEGCDSIRRVAAFKQWSEGLKGFGEPFEVRYAC